MEIRTDKILNDVRNGTSDENAVCFVDEMEIRREIGADIKRTYGSRSKFADVCGIQGSHLSDFFKGTRHFRRDNLLAMFLVLHYDLDRIQTMLKRLEEVKPLSM